MHTHLAQTKAFCMKMGVSLFPLLCFLGYRAAQGSFISQLYRIVKVHSKAPEIHSLLVANYQGSVFFSKGVRSDFQYYWDFPTKSKACFSGSQPFFLGLVRDCGISSPRN